MHRIEETIARGICIGCGACSAATGGAVRVQLGPTRLYEAKLSGAADDERVRSASRVCPFSDESPNEDALGAPHGDEAMVLDQNLGQYSRTFAGRVNDEEYLAGSSSGGLASWLISQLLCLDLADAVLHVGAFQGEANNEGILQHGISVSGRTNRKSQYYATSMAEALTLIGAADKRFIIVGVPCFIRAARSLCREVPLYGERIVYFIGLVCGHYKTQAFAESLAWQLGVPPQDLAAIDFRVKTTDRPANDYGFSATSSRTSETKFAANRDLVGTNWGHGAFQPEACNFCDDVVGETADVSFGDAWLPEYVSYPLGTNVVVSRNREIDTIFDSGQAAGEIAILATSADQVRLSQSGGFRHRREGLAVRLSDDQSQGLSTPRKRVSPEAAADVAPRRVKLIRHRRRMAETSHLAFQKAVDKNDLAIYLQHHGRLAAQYRRIDLPLARRVAQDIKSILRRPVRWVYDRCVGASIG